jgi:phage-related baseplate assembly protein
MISLNGVEMPQVLRTLDYEEILTKNINNFKVLVPNWQPLESDEFTIVNQAFAYDELHLRAEFNNIVKAFFLPFATGNDLDYLAFTFYGGIKRLQGSKPYATYEFSLSDVLGQDVVIPTNLILTDETSTYEAKLLSDVVISAGEDKASGTVELQLEIKSSEIKTEIITTPLPFVIKASAKDTFLNGSDIESDEEFKQRILLSMADKSTAGSEETYKSFTFNADERIEDVAVGSGLKPLLTYVPLFVGQDETGILAALTQVFTDMATVEVFYYSQNADSLMQTRIEEILSSDDVIPLTDKVNVHQATQVPFSINAELKILPNQETATVYSNAMAALDLGIKSLKQIGTDITLSEINEFLKVPGVKEVVISAPTSNVVVANDSIGVNSANSITYTII